MKKKLKKLLYGALALIVLYVVGDILWIKAGQGPSRYLGRSAAMQIHIKGLVRVIGISNRTLIGDSVKDITFLGDDGYIHTQEVKNFSIFNGEIRWVPFGEGSSWIRTRQFSRMGFGEVDLELPEDFGEMDGVQVQAVLEKRTCKETLTTPETTYMVETDDHVKYLSYFPKKEDGTIDHTHLVVKEYYDGFVDRGFEGWVDVTPK